MAVVQKNHDKPSSFWVHLWHL